MLFYLYFSIFFVFLYFCIEKNQQYLHMSDEPLYTQISQQQVDQMNKQKLLSQKLTTTPTNYIKNSKNNTFTPNVIVPPTRHIKINEHCYAIYSTLHKVPLAVHQFLDSSIVQGTVSREGYDFYKQTQNVKEGDQKFYADSSYFDKTQAYKVLSYDKGHMAPARNYGSSQKLMASTYTYANCIPQNSYFNRGSWKNIEGYCRKLLRQNLCQTMEIISGPVFYSGDTYKNSQTIFQNHQIVMLENGVVVPPKCYKIIKANVKNESFLTIFVMRNQKVIDNDIKLKSSVVSVQQLQILTGLRFNLGKCKDLAQLDPIGMNKTFGQLHKEFFTKLFLLGKTIADMNAARIQGFGYKVSIDMNARPQQQKLYIAEEDYKNIIQQVGWNRTKAKSRRKINALLSLHKDCTQTHALNEDLEKKIISSIQDNLQTAQKEQDKQYQRFIIAKLYKDNYKYHYPLEQALKQIFPNPTTTSPTKSVENEGQDDETNIEPNTQESQKTVKKAIRKQRGPRTIKVEKIELKKEQIEQQDENTIKFVHH